MTDTILDKIKAYKLDEIAAAKSERPLAQVEAAARDAAPVRDFAEALHNASRDGYALIAEVKKASPSKGLIRENFDPAAIAESYETGGAACLSVLTDTPSFQGAPEYLQQARAACDLPVLRKDFMFDPYQVAEARAWGADCILIIMAAVTDAEAIALEEAALELNMATLVEVHDADELDRATALKSRLLGINNRDLRTFDTSLDVTRDLSKRVPAGKIIIAESGLTGPDDLADLARYGVRSFLVGETLMREDDIAAATRRLLADPVKPMGL